MLKMLKIIARLAKKNRINIYLVGGAVRDHLLNYNINDFDFVLKSKALKISREFANEINGKHLIMDENNEVYRVIKEDFKFDFTVFKGKSIKNDLSNRDFTINAMAIKDDFFKKLNFESKGNLDNFNKNNIIDPYKGVIDLDKKIIKAVNKKIFDRDPLRILRAIRFKAKYFFKIEKETKNLMIEKKEKLRNVAKERIHDELLKIFSYNNSAQIFNYIFNEIDLFYSRKGNLDIDFIYNVLEAIDSYPEKKKSRFYIDEKKLPLFKITVILRELFEKVKSLDEVKSLLKKSKFSNSEILYILKLLANYNKIFDLYSKNNLKKKNIYEIIKVTKKYTPDIALFSLFIVLNSNKFKDNSKKRNDYREYIHRFLNKYTTIKEKTREPLINGKDIMKILNISESPEIGKYIEELKKAQAFDLVKSKKEAVEFIKKLNN